MKRIAIISMMVLLGIGVGGLAIAHGPGYGGGGGYGMGPGMMHGYGGYGMMGPGQGYGGYPCGVWQEPGTGGKLTKESVKSLLENRLAYQGNPNLKLGKIVEKDRYFAAQIVTKDNSLVQELRIDKDTGRIYPVY